LIGVPENAMATRDNVETIKTMLERFRAGDFAAVVELCRPDAEWCIGVGGEEGIVPYAGVHRGQDGILNFLSRFRECAETKLFEARDFIAEGEKVVVTGCSELVARPTRGEYGGGWVLVITLKSGEVARLDMLGDSARAVSAWQGA
jgi:uncharacterized protein